MKTAYDIILATVISEQSMDVAADKKYTFKVATDANKTQVKLAVEEIFGVEVAKVNIMNYDGKVDFWKDSYIKDSVEKRILEYCNASLVKWIDYIFFKEDIIHDSISDEDKQFIESKMVNLTQMLDKIADDYIIISFSPQTK